MCLLQAILSMNHKPDSNRASKKIPRLVALLCSHVSNATDTLNTSHPSYEPFTVNVSNTVSPNLRQTATFDETQVGF